MQRLLKTLKTCNDSQSIQEVIDCLNDLSITSAQLNELDVDGFAVLHHVALYGLPEPIVDLLMQKGCVIDCRNKVQETPLLLAALYGHADTVKALLKHNPNPTYADWRGKTVLAAASDTHRGDNIFTRKEVSRLIEEALASPRVVEMRASADKLREEGNTKYAAGKIEDALRKYAEALELIQDDYRVWSNSAICLIKMNTERDAYIAIEAAHHCTRMNPTFAKGWCRLVQPHLFLRSFAHAKWFANEGLKHCPDCVELQSIDKFLKEKGVPDFIPGFGAKHEAMELLQRGVQTIQCSYCKQMVPVPPAQSCPWCACNPTGPGMGSEPIPSLV